jgi:predicted ATPase
MIYLRSIHTKFDPVPHPLFPFNLRIFKSTSGFEFDSPVTFFVGENGSGKSTLLEGIAAAIGAVAVGGENIQTDSTLAHARKLAKNLKMIWSRKIHKGFFLRAEDFFNFTRQLSKLSQDFEKMANDYDKSLSGYGLQLAKGVVLGQKKELADKYGDNPDASSHGESFLKLFKARFSGSGLYLLDEPETPLSPKRQLTLLSMMKEMVEENNSQFIIATHSPILMAYPNASILNFDSDPVQKVDFNEVEHVSLTKIFLNQPDLFLKHL